MGCFRVAILRETLHLRLTSSALTIRTFGGPRHSRPKHSRPTLGAKVASTPDRGPLFISAILVGISQDRPRRLGERVSIASTDRLLLSIDSWNVGRLSGPERRSRGLRFGCIKWCIAIQILYTTSSCSFISGSELSCTVRSKTRPFICMIFKEKFIQMNRHFNYHYGSPGNETGRGSYDT